MPQRKEDEIMAEYLLKGGKMLEKCCTTCGCPLFEYKQKTFCVVCAEYGQAQEPKKLPVTQAAAGPLPQNNNSNAVPAPATARRSPETEAIATELAGTLLSLCHRIKNEGDPDRCLALMDSVKIGTEALQILRQL
jgi:UPF0148 protein